MFIKKKKDHWYELKIGIAIQIAIEAQFLFLLYCDFRILTSSF